MKRGELFTSIEIFLSAIFWKGVSIIEEISKTAARALQSMGYKLHCITLH